MARSFLYYLRRKGQVMALRFTSPEFVSKFYFRHLLKYPLNLKDPKTFNEKVQWLKLYEWPNNPIAIQCGDKYAVRSYVEEKGMSEYLNELLFVWESVEDIDWDKLPDRFALKCTHGCGYNIICEDKSKLDISAAKKQLKRWMKEDFGTFNAEPHYSKMKPRIICEKFLGGEITDYKFYCFHGRVAFMYVAYGFGHGINETIAFFDKDGNPAPYRRTDYPVFDGAVLPRNFDKMKELSEILSKDVPFVRVDWFEEDGKIYFGELTYTPCGGLMKIDPIEYDTIWGDLLDISELVKKHEA